MLTEPLPSTLDVRKLAARGVSVSGTLRPLDLQRFQPLLAGDEGTIEAHLVFPRDEENRHVIHVSVEAEVTLICQRCLEPMSEHLASDNTLVIVWTDEQAAHLPRHLEPLIVEQDACSLWELVEDELILAMPPFSYHDTEDCKERVVSFSDPALDESVAVEKPKRCNVLAQLQPGNKQ